MLVLSRKVGESIQVGEDVHLMVTSIEGGVVKLSFRAPPAIKIIRTEVIGKYTEEQLREKDEQRRRKVAERAAAQAPTEKKVKVGDVGKALINLASKRGLS